MISTYKPTAAFVKQMRLSGNCPSSSPCRSSASRRSMPSWAPSPPASRSRRWCPSRTAPLRRSCARCASCQPRCFRRRALPYHPRRLHRRARGRRRSALGGSESSREKFVSALESLKDYDVGGFPRTMRWQPPRIAFRRGHHRRQERQADALNGIPSSVPSAGLVPAILSTPTSSARPHSPINDSIRPFRRGPCAIAPCVASSALADDAPISRPRPFPATGAARTEVLGEGPAFRGRLQGRCIVGQ